MPNWTRPRSRARPCGSRRWCGSESPHVEGLGHGEARLCRCRLRHLRAVRFPRIRQHRRKPMPTGPKEGAFERTMRICFERFFYFLEDNSDDEQGIVVFDELEKSKATCSSTRCTDILRGPRWASTARAASSPSPSSCTATSPPACRSPICLPTSFPGASASPQ